MCARNSNETRLAELKSTRSREQQLFFVLQRVLFSSHYLILHSIHLQYFWAAAAAATTHCLTAASKKSIIQTPILSQNCIPMYYILSVICEIRTAFVCCCICSFCRYKRHACQNSAVAAAWLYPVSYTHLTLPTIYSV